MRSNLVLLPKTIVTRIFIVFLCFYTFINCSQESFLSKTSSIAEYPIPSFTKTTFDETGNNVVLSIQTYILDPRDFIYSGGIVVYRAHSKSSLENILQDDIKIYASDLSKKPHFFTFLKFSKLTSKTKLKDSLPMQETSLKLPLQQGHRSFIRVSAMGKNTLLGFIKEDSGYFETSASDIFSISRRCITSITVTNTGADGIQLLPTGANPAEKGTEITLSIIQNLQKTSTIKGAVFIPSGAVVLQNTGFKSSQEVADLITVPDDNGFSSNHCPVADGHLVFAKKQGVTFALFIEGLNQEQLDSINNTFDTLSFSVKIIRSEISDNKQI